MTLLNRGIDLYLLVLAFVGTLALVWGANEFLLKNVTAGTGWVIVVGVAALLVLAGVGARRLMASDDDRTVSDPGNWSSRK